MELSRIQKICAQVFDSKIKFGYIFGSAAKGRLSAHSDIDVAIWLKDAPASTDSAFHLKISYGVKLSDLLGRDLDLVILNDADLIIAMQVIDQGVAFGVQDKKEFARFKANTMTRYADFKFSRKIIEDRLSDGRIFKK